MATARNEPFVVSKSQWEELFILTKLCVPLCLTWIVEFLGNLICIAYIGNLSNASTLLSSVGLSKTLFTILFVSLYGMTTSLYTLVPQAIGANKYHLLPIYIQRCFYLVLIMSIPFVIILCYGGDIMRLALPSDDVDWDRVSQDCKYFIITLYIYVILCILQRVPQATNLNGQLLACTIVALVFVYPSCYFYISYLDLGSSGYALNMATIIFITTLCTLFVLYKNDLLYILKPVPLHKIFETEAIKEFLHLSLPGTVLHLLECISFEFATFYCSLITRSDIAISAAAIIIVIMNINLFVSMAMSTAFSVRIGKYIGANMVQKAQESVKCGKLLSFILSFVTFLILIGARKPIAEMYTNDEEIIELTSSVLYVTAVSAFFFMGVYARYGIFRGIGKPKFPAYTVLGSYYLVPLPLMFVFLFVFDLRNSLLYGTLCIFITVGVGNFIAMMIMEFYLLFQLDWVNILHESQQRLSETERIHYERIKDEDNVTLQQV